MCVTYVANLCRVTPYCISWIFKNGVQIIHFREQIEVVGQIIMELYSEVISRRWWRRRIWLGIPTCKAVENIRVGVNTFVFLTIAMFIMTTVFIVNIVIAIVLAVRRR
jgi:hypothetical protein